MCCGGRSPDTGFFPRQVSSCSQVHHTLAPSRERHTHKHRQRSTRRSDYSPNPPRTSHSRLKQLLRATNPGRVWSTSQQPLTNTLLVASGVRVWRGGHRTEMLSFSTSLMVARSHTTHHTHAHRISYFYQAIAYSSRKQTASRARPDWKIAAIPGLCLGVMQSRHSANWRVPATVPIPPRVTHGHSTPSIQLN